MIYNETGDEMAPKTKFSRDEIVDVAFDLARFGGIDAVTAREVGKRLGTSASPVFTVFASMEELKKAVKALAGEKFRQYMESAVGSAPTLERIGALLVRFAREEPSLFELLFLTRRDDPGTLSDLIGEMGGSILPFVEMAGREQELSYEEAYALLERVWVYCYGMCVLCARRICSFSDRESEHRIGQEIKAALILIKLSPQGI